MFNLKENKYKTKVLQKFEKKQGKRNELKKPLKALSVNNNKTNTLTKVYTERKVEKITKRKTTIFIYEGSSKPLYTL